MNEIEKVKYFNGVIYADLVYVGGSNTLVLYVTYLLGRFWK